MNNIKNILLFVIISLGGAVLLLILCPPPTLADSDPCVPYQDIDYCNPAMDQPGMEIQPSLNLQYLPLYCTADCNVRSVEVCIPDTTHCTQVEALFCTTNVNNKCVQVFNSFVD
jgi:hypothetical protein